MNTWEIVLRIGVFALVAVVAFLWPRDLRRYWATWDPRARRITLAVMPVFITNGLAMLNAVYLGRSVTWATWAIALSYVILAGALLYRPPSERG